MIYCFLYTTAKMAKKKGKKYGCRQLLGKLFCYLRYYKRHETRKAYSSFGFDTATHKYLPLEFFCCADKFIEPKSIENLVPTDKMKLLMRMSSEKEAEHDQKGINLMENHIKKELST